MEQPLASDRGHWITERHFGIGHAAAAAGHATVEPISRRGDDPGSRFEKIGRSDLRLVNSKMDPAGFALEIFDIMGGTCATAIAPLRKASPRSEGFWHERPGFCVSYALR